MEIERLRPPPNEDTKPYWDGLKGGRLVLQKCANCGTVRHYPRPVCSNCYSLEVEWVEASGRGRAHSWTVSHHAFHPAFRHDLPMTIVTADMEEGVRMCAVLRNADGPPTLGMPVRVGFEPVDDMLSVPIFLPG